MPEHNNIRDFFDVDIEHFPDRSARWLFQHWENVKGLLEILAADLAKLIDFQRLNQLNRSYIPDNLREQESDLVFRVPFRDGSEELEIYILIEHQSTVDPTMGFRLLFYMTHIWDAQRREWESNNVPKSQWRFRPILPIVYYTGTQKWNTPLTMQAVMDVPDALSRFIPKYEALFLSVKETDVSVLTKPGNPFGWLLTVLQKEDASKEEMQAALRKAMSYIDTLDETQAYQRRRAITYLLLLIMYRRPADERQEMESLIDRYIQHPSDKEELELMAQTSVEYFVEQGMKQGLEQGETSAKREVILKVLNARFDAVPESVANRITSIQNLSRLNSLFDHALTAQTLDEIELEKYDA